MTLQEYSKDSTYKFDSDAKRDKPREFVSWLFDVLDLAKRFDGGDRIDEYVRQSYDLKRYTAPPMPAAGGIEVQGDRPVTAVTGDLG